MQTDYDILIIGGGMVGASLGLALGSAGLQVGVVEAVPYGGARQPSYDDRTVALSYSSKRIYSALGIWPQLMEQGATAISQIHVSDRGHFGFTRLANHDAGVEALGYVVENRLLGAALFDALKGLPSVHFITPAVLQDIHFDAQRATASVQCTTGMQALSARLLVAADGADSAVRRLAGIQTRQHMYSQTALVTNITPSRPHEGMAYERFTDTGPLALLPMSANRYALVWSLPPDQAQALQSLDDQAFLQHLQTAFGGRAGEFIKVGTRQTYPLARMRVADPVRARLVVIGNAAHSLHPVAGQGFNLGLRDVALLAQDLVEALQAGQDPGDETVLRRYAEGRQRDTFMVSALTDGLVRIFSKRTRAWILGRDLGLLAVDLLPPLKRHLLRRTMGLAGSLPRLARGLPLLP